MTILARTRTPHTQHKHTTHTHAHTYCKTLDFYFFIFHVRENEKRCHCCDTSFWQIKGTIISWCSSLTSCLAPFYFVFIPVLKSSFMQKSLIIFFPIILISLVWIWFSFFFQTSALHDPLYEKFVGWFTIYN